MKTLPIVNYASNRLSCIEGNQTVLRVLDNELIELVTLNGKLHKCSHWEKLLAMERAGIVKRIEPGGYGIPPEYGVTL